jgi:AcrR family transcriptional regulator
MDMNPVKAKRRLSQDDWADAALRAIGEGGLAAVAVEPLAAKLGATKGSFYWHFANREALIEAALARWEIEHTETVIRHTESAPDPVGRLKSLFTLVVRHGGHDRIEVALLATADHPLVAPVLRRVTERRIGYITSLYEQAGLAPAEARHRALLTFTAWLGKVQLEHTLPDVLPVGDESERYLDFFLDTLMP